MAGVHCDTVAGAGVAKLATLQKKALVSERDKGTIGHLKLALEFVKVSVRHVTRDCGSSKVFPKHGLSFS